MAAVDSDPNDLPASWTGDHVGHRLLAAFKVLDKLPRVKGPRQPGGHWPRHMVEWADQLAQSELPQAERDARALARNELAFRPSPTEIARMETALDWLRELRLIDPGLALIATLWAYRAARGGSLKKLCRERSWAPHMFYRKRSKALDCIAAALNAQGLPVT
jgi:hypothetical protein